MLPYRMSVSGFSGDGAIRPIGGTLGNYGYRVDFERFSLNAPFAAEYALKGLPKFKGPIVVFVEVTSRRNEEELRNRLTGTLTLQVEASDGERLFRCQAPMGEWIFSYSRGYEQGTWIYEIYSDFDMPAQLAGTDRDSSILYGPSIAPGQAFRLSVAYDPGEEGVDETAQVVIRAGGSY